MATMVKEHKDKKKSKNRQTSEKEADRPLIPTETNPGEEDVTENKPSSGKKKSKNRQTSEKEADRPLIPTETNPGEEDVTENKPSSGKKKSKNRQTSEKEADRPLIPTGTNSGDEDVTENKPSNGNKESKSRQTSEDKQTIPSETTSGEEQAEKNEPSSGVTEDTNVIEATSVCTAVAVDHTHIPSERIITSTNTDISTNMGSLKINEDNENRQDTAIHPECVEANTELEDAAPSAPMLEENEPLPYTRPYERMVEKVFVKRTCMSFDNAVKLFGEKEIAEVKALSDKEADIVQAGPQWRPDHPLVDLLHTFRTSLIAVERESRIISTGYIEEEKKRDSLWIVKECKVYVEDECNSCAEKVGGTVSYVVAKLQKEKLPAAQLRLQSLLKDVQENYCHHQNAALQAHYEIDILMESIMTRDRRGMREALMLVLRELQLSGAAPEVYAQALQRWAKALAHKLLDQRDLAQLLFLLHNLFRQTRSVQWASLVVELHVPDSAAAARLVAVLELLLARSPLEEARECTEESEAWEELLEGDEGGAVGEGQFRERDLLALLDALPLQEMLARMMLFEGSNILKEYEQSWGDRSGGRGVLRASCGVRVLLSVLQRALTTHAAYLRLRARLRRLAVAALGALAALHAHCRHSYSEGMEESVAAELQACFVAGLGVVGEEAHALPAALLDAALARRYCDTLIAGLHEAGALQVEGLSAVVAPQSCALRVRAVCQAALDRELDRELALTVLAFLFEIGIKHWAAGCKGGCDATARELLPQLVTRLGLHVEALHTLAELSRVEALEPQVLQTLAPEQWRATPAQLCAVLDDWAQRCDHLLPPLLLALDYTPHTGLSLESQLAIGAWLCAWVRERRAEPQWEWQVLWALRLHRTHWGLPLEAPPCEQDLTDYFSMAYALLTSDWGHCLPLVCSAGVKVLCLLAAAHASKAVHCLGPIMRVMAQSPHSISLTPKFMELFATILNSGPSLMQRALGRRTLSGQELLQQLLLDQMQDATVSRGTRRALLSAWLHALWRSGVPAGGLAVLDGALRFCQDWDVLDAHAASLLEEAREYMADAVCNASLAPLLCEALLRGALAADVRSQLHARLQAELARQRAAKQKIHVSRALKHIQCGLAPDELPIYGCAYAVLSVPPQHPAQLMLWRLFFHMYLQRPPGAPLDTTPPVGPLFFSGIVKSHTLSQLKKRLQDTEDYHRAQAEALKASRRSIQDSPSSLHISPHSSPSATDSVLFEPLTLADIVPVEEKETTDLNTDRSAERGDEYDEVASAQEAEACSRDRSLLCYHRAAQRLAVEYLVFLTAGETARASPEQADIGRFISDEALATAWYCSVEGPSGCESPAAPDPMVPAPAPPPAPPLSQCERAVRAILTVPPKHTHRYEVIFPEVLAVATKKHINIRDDIEVFQQCLALLESHSRDWVSHVDHVAQMDARLWELVSTLHVCRPCQPVVKTCSRKCATYVLHVDEMEWFIPPAVEEEILVNRYRARREVRALARPRACDVQHVCCLLALARSTRSQSVALRLVNLAAGAVARVEQHALVRDAICACVEELAQKFICMDAELTIEYLERWNQGSSAQQRLCLSLISPQCMDTEHWARLYAFILFMGQEPHIVFSYLSKFDVSAWADAASSEQRADVLLYLLEAAQRWGPAPDEQQKVLLELLNIQSKAAVREPELCLHVLRCAEASLASRLPPAYLHHLLDVVMKHGDALNYDQLGMFLRNLGALFWKARAEAADREVFAEYAPPLTDTVHLLLCKLLRAALDLTYEPERVGRCFWLAALEAWGAWVTPHRSAPLTSGPAQDDTLRRFAHSLGATVQALPSAAELLLRLVFQWAVLTCLSAEPGWPAESHALMSALLARLAALPWQTCQWFHVETLSLTLQMSRSPQLELTSWCSSCMFHFEAHTWIRGAADEDLASVLVNLLAIFTSKQLPLAQETLAAACALPWERVPEPALHAALEHFFAEHFSPALPYHKAPCFRVVLSACHLLPGTAGGAGELQAEKRANGVSQWTRAAAAPPLGAHVRDHAAAVLATIAALGPELQEGRGELTRLLSRALVLLCVEPAAASALQVWLEWVSSCSARLRRAATAATATLTSLEHFAPLAEQLAKAALSDRASGGWRELAARWSGCPWGAADGCAALLARGALHAAYALLLARPPAPDGWRRALAELLAASINFTNSELIVCVWICVACRAALASEGAGEGAAEGAAEGAGAYCADAARTLLASWADQRRTLVQVVTLRAADLTPTPQQRLLCRLALCIASPSEGAAAAFLSASRPVLGADAALWVREARPQPCALPRLAAKLYPQHEMYFAEELSLTAASSEDPTPGA